jgi:hypothetical protein
MTAFISLFPQGGGFIAVLEDLRTGRVVEIDKPDVVSKSKEVTAYMRKRFDQASFDPARDVGTMVCFDRMCSEADAKVGLMAYSECALEWVTYRYEFTTIRQASRKMHRLAASRNMLTLTWPGLLNLTGEHLTPSKCATCATAVTRTDPHMCGGCHNKTYCSRACQKADWPHHRESCVAGTRTRTHTRFVEFYNLFKNGAQDPVIDKLRLAEHTVMLPKRSLQSLHPDTRDVVLARNKRMQFKSRDEGHCRQADARLDDEGEGDDGSVAYVRADVAQVWNQKVMADRAA